MNATIKKFVKDMANRKVAYSKAKAALEAVGHADSAKAADAILAEFGYEKSTQKRGIQARMYEFLLNNPTVSEEEFHNWIVENGTPNTLRWEKSHQKVRELTNELYNNLNK